MDEAMKAKNHVTSAASFVEDGMQDACDDACSICLEAFCDSNPSTVTSCKHEFHLQCVLEWCQRSSSCPMCWQPISLKDPTSQELLEVVERERSFRSMPSRNAAIFHHPTLGDFELQHIPVGLDAAELEDRILQHFAAAIGRTQRIARRSSSPHAPPQLVMLSANHNASLAGPDGAENESAATTVNDLSPPHMPSSIRINRTSGSSSRSPDVMATRQGISHSSRTLRNHAREPSLANVGPSEFQSISDSWKSRLSTMSMKYKDSLSKSTRGWKDKLFSRSSSMAEIGSEVLREVNAGMASVSRMMDRLETRENNIATRSPGANGSTTGYSNQDCRGTPNSSNTCSFATSYALFCAAFFSFFFF